jgi:hypothetical protein
MSQAPALGAPPRSALEPTLLRAGIALAVVLGVVEIASQLVNEHVLDERRRHLDVDTEWNLWAWEGSVTFLVAALAVLLCAVAHPRWRGRLLALGAWLAFLSADDVVEVHERLGIRLGSALGIAEGEEAARLGCCSTSLRLRSRSCCCSRSREGSARLPPLARCTPGSCCSRWPSAPSWQER